MPDLDLISYLEPITSACPLQAGPLTTTVRDLQLAVGWVEQRPLVLPGTKWCAIVGRKRKEDPMRAVLPLPLNTTALKPSELRLIFKALEGLDIGSLPDNVPDIAGRVEDLRQEYEKRMEVKDRKDGERVDALKEEEEEHAREVEESEIKKQVVEDEVKTEEVRDRIDAETIYVAIGSSDSTIVYYKLSKGIRKPHDIPDE